LRNVHGNDKFAVPQVSAAGPGVASLGVVPSPLGVREALVELDVSFGAHSELGGGPIFMLGVEGDMESQRQGEGEEAGNIGFDEVHHG